MPTGRLLVATDGSEPARAAEKAAGLLANSLGECEIEVVTVIHPRSQPYSRSRPFGPQSSAEDVRRAEELLAQAAERIRAVLTNPRARVFEQLLEGDSPAAALIAESEATGEPAPIVIGNRGLGGFAGLVLGSVSTQVLQGAKGPVVLIKTRAAKSDRLGKK